MNIENFTVPDVVVNAEDFDNPDIYAKLRKLLPMPISGILQADNELTANDKVTLFLICESVPDEAKRALIIRAVKETPVLFDMKAVELITDRDVLKVLELAEDYVCNNGSWDNMADAYYNARRRLNHDARPSIMVDRICWAAVSAGCADVPKSALEHLLFGVEEFLSEESFYRGVLRIAQSIIQSNHYGIGIAEKTDYTPEEIANQLDFVESENQYVKDSFDLTDILDFSKTHQIEILREADYSYHCYIDKKAFGPSMTPLHALVWGIMQFRNISKSKTQHPDW